MDSRVDSEVDSGVDPGVKMLIFHWFTCISWCGWTVE